MTPPGGWTQAFIEHLGIELWRIPVVVASAIGIYLIFLLLVRVFGVRVLSGWTGFDAVVLGAVMPSMIEDPGFGLTPASGTVVATAGLFGMMVGALGMGWATDRFGRRRMLKAPSAPRRLSS